MNKSTQLRGAFIGHARLSRHDLLTAAKLGRMVLSQFQGLN